MTRLCWVVLCAMLVASGGRAAEPLRWGADAQSGAPYVFHDPADQARITGFETEIIEAVAGRLGRKPVFVQNDWDGLIPGLQRGLYDVVIDGLEITPDHAAARRFLSAVLPHLRADRGAARECRPG